MKKLIVNADDFGLDMEVNRGIELCHQKGIVTSTSIVPGGKCFEDGIEILKRNHLLGVGIHITFVLSKPVSEPEKIKSLLKKSGSFRDSWYDFFLAFIAGRIRKNEIEIEIEAQIKKLVDIGITPSHLDSHQHLHLLPGIIDSVIKIAKKYGIKWIRVPTEPGLLNIKADSSIIQRAKYFFYMLLTLKSPHQVKSSGLCYADRCYGLIESGRMGEEALISCFKRLAKGVNEIFVHPGISKGRKEIAGIKNYSWDMELNALISERIIKFIKENGIVLTNYRSI